MKFAELIKNMNLKQRRLLQESVKKRMLQEADGASDVLSAPVRSSLKKDGKEIFRKTQQGWKTTVRLTRDQVLGLVKPESRDTVKRGLEKLGQGDEYPIAKGSLIDPEMASDKGGITFQREGDLFADPSVVPDEVINSLKGSLDLIRGKDKDSKGVQEDSKTWAIGDALVRIFSDNTVKIEIKDDERGTYLGFEDIFGQGSGIANKIQAAVGKKNPNVLVFKISDATERSLIQQMSKSFLRDLDIGKIRFERDKPGTPYFATIKGKNQAKAVEEILRKMKEDGQASE